MSFAAPCVNVVYGVANVVYDVSSGACAAKAALVLPGVDTCRTLIATSPARSSVTVLANGVCGALQANREIASGTAPHGRKELPQNAATDSSVCRRVAPRHVKL